MGTFGRNELTKYFWFTLYEGIEQKIRFLVRNRPLNMEIKKYKKIFADVRI